MTDDSHTPFRASPAYEAHLAARARFHVNSGWRRVDYFGSNEDPSFEHLRPEGEAGEAWSTAVVAEHFAVRQRAGLFDLSTFGKIEVAGPGAAKFLEWVCANRVARGKGRMTYTQLLNDNGGVQCDLTVSQLEEDLFVMITNTGVLDHDLSWLREHARTLEAGSASSVTITNVTNAWAVFGLWGPLSRDILQPLVDIPLDNDAFPFLTVREANIAGFSVRLSRVTFVGELGWEVYVPTGYGRWLWGALSQAVSEAGGLRCGFMAIDTLRAEKGYLYLGDDIRADRTPWESGLGAFVRDDKDFFGKEAALGRKNSKEVLRSLRIDGTHHALKGGEPLRGPGGLTTQLTSGGVGYTVESSIGFAFLPVDLPNDVTLEVEVDGASVPAYLATQPLYDPRSERIRS